MSGKLEPLASKKKTAIEAKIKKTVKKIEALQVKVKLLQKKFTMLSE